MNYIIKIPGLHVLSTLLKVGVIGGLGAYGVSKSIYNVEAGHRSIVFNRKTGIKDKVRTSLEPIEAKQVAAQDAERAKFIVEKAEQDKKSAVIRAQGEAKSAQLIGEAIANNEAFIVLRKIEAAREIARTVANSENKVYLSSDELLLNIQAMNLEPSSKPNK